MANLNSTTTDGCLSFVKYVTDNKRFAEVEYEIEKNQSTSVYVKEGRGLKATSSKIHKEGTKLKIVDAKFHEFNGTKFAAVKIGSVSGFIPIKSIRKPTGGNGTQYEDEVVDAINHYILSSGGKIDIKIKGSNKLYKDICYAIKVDKSIKQENGLKRDPKADIILCKDKKAPTAAGSIYISHKKAGGAESIQQYGGLSKLASLEIYNHKLVQKFLKEVANIIGNSDRLSQPILGTFKDDRLSCLSTYGPDYGKKFSMQHVQLIGQGNPVMHNKGKYIELDFPNHLSLSGQLLHGAYLPVFAAVFRSGRGFDYNGKRYNGVRLGIYPYKKIVIQGKIIKIEIK